MNFLVKSIAKRPIVFILVSMFLILLFFGAAYLASGKGSDWQGYYILVFPQGLPDKAVLNDYSTELGVVDLISRETQLVRVSEFTHLETVPLARLEERYDLLDPRLDPFIRGLEHYFTGPEGGAIIYVKSATLPMFFYGTSLVFFKVRNVSVLFPDMPGLKQLVLAFVFLAFVLTVVLLYKNQRYAWFVFLLFTPWILSAATAGNLFFVLLMGMVFPLHSFFMEFLWHLENRLDYGYAPDYRSLRFRALLLLLFLLFMTVILVVNGLVFFMTRIIFSLVLDCLFALSFMAFRLLWKRKKSAHSFFPLPVPAFVNKPKRRLPVHFPVFAPLVLVFAGAFLFLFVSEKVFSPGLCPLPVYNGAFSRDFKGLRALWASHSGESLPDLSDFVAHSFFQENFAYGGSYDFPRINEELLSDKYTIDHNKKINQTYTTLKKFDSLWLQHLFDGLSQGNILNLLAGQRNSVSVQYQNSQSALGLRGFWLWVLAFFSLLLLSHFFLDYYLTPSSMCDKKLIAVTE
ncbi:MAG: hypothetical protein JXR70_19860 [Spirochaetales bacterium]|nr:hypothetical protein [Spirochaetales bacterium]